MAVLWNEGTVPRTLNHCVVYRWLYSFTLRPLHRQKSPRYLWAAMLGSARCLTGRFAHARNRNANNRSSSPPPSQYIDVVTPAGPLTERCTDVIRSLFERLTALQDFWRKSLCSCKPVPPLRCYVEWVCSLYGRFEITCRPHPQGPSSPTYASYTCTRAQTWMTLSDDVAMNGRMISDWVGKFGSGFGLV